MLNQRLIAEFKYEAVSTKKMLEKVPSDKWDWKPHEKSMTLGRLASHVASLFDWMSVTLTTDELDFAKGDYKPPTASSTENLLEVFDNVYQKAMKLLENADDDTMQGKWTFKNGNHVIFTRPRIDTLRFFVMNHLIHHRGQLSVYLRMLDVPIPGMYGPSADER